MYSKKEELFKMTDLKLIFREPEKFADQTVEIGGWIRNNRASNKFGFIELNDGTFFMVSGGIFG